MKASGKIGSNGVYVSGNVERRFETDIHKYTGKTEVLEIIAVSLADLKKGM